MSNITKEEKISEESTSFVSLQTLSIISGIFFLVFFSMFLVVGLHLNTSLELYTKNPEGLKFTLIGGWIFLSIYIGTLFLSGFLINSYDNKKAKKSN